MANRETGLLKKDAAATASRTYIFHPKCHQLRYLCLHLHRTAIPPPALLQEILAPELQLHRFSFVTSHQILLRIVPEYLSIRPHYLGLSCTCHHLTDSRQFDAIGIVVIIISIPGQPDQTASF